MIVLVLIPSAGSSFFEAIITREPCSNVIDTDVAEDTSFLDDGSIALAEIVAVPVVPCGEVYTVFATPVPSVVAVIVFKEGNPPTPVRVNVTTAPDTGAPVESFNNALTSLVAFPFAKSLLGFAFTFSVPMGSVDGL